MFSYIVRRSLVSCLLLVVVSLISFFIITLTPGSPYPWGDLNPKVSEEVKANYERKFYLDRPLPTQYVLVMRDLFTGNLVSNKDERPVLKKIGERIPATLLLNLVSFAMVFGLGIPLGVVAARYRGRWPDTALTLVSFTCIALPGFWIAYMLIILLVNTVGVPLFGLSTFGAVHTTWGSEFLDRVWHLIVPASVLAIYGTAVQSRYVRASMIDALGSDYVRTARAKGLAEDVVLYKHTLRNSLRPVITGIGLLFPALLGGSVIIESIFAYPGMGRLGFEAVLERDYPVLVALNFTVAALVLAGNFLADLLYAVVDPQVRLK